MYTALRVVRRPDQQIGLPVKRQQTEPVADDRHQVALTCAMRGPDRPGRIGRAFDAEFIPAVAAIKRADRLVIHSRDGKPLHMVASDVAVPERAEGKGWELGAAIDFERTPVLADLIVGAADGRRSEREVTCFLNNLGMGYQFAAAGAVVYRRARENGLGHELPTDWFTEDVHP